MLARHPDDIEFAFQKSFRELDCIINPWAKLIGSTALITYIVNDTIWVANIGEIYSCIKSLKSHPSGDSRAVVSVGGIAQRLSKDHKPNDEDELKRITKLGGHYSFVVGLLISFQVLLKEAESKVALVLLVLLEIVSSRNMCHVNRSYFIPRSVRVS